MIFFRWVAQPPTRRSRFTISKGHVFTIPKRVTKNHLGCWSVDCFLNLWPSWNGLVWGVIGAGSYRCCFFPKQFQSKSTHIFPKGTKVDVLDIGLYWNVFYVDMLKQFLAVLVGFGNPHSLRGFSFASPPGYPRIVYSDPKLVFHPFPFPWFIQLNWVRWCITPTKHFGILHTLNSINHNLWVENPMSGNSSVHKRLLPTGNVRCPLKREHCKRNRIFFQAIIFEGQAVCGE